MIKALVFFIILLPLGCFAQFTLSGRVLNQANTKPVANASVFFNNATIGAKTLNDGTFALHNVKPGRYELIVSIVGFENYSQSVVVSNADRILPDITIFPKTISLKEVHIKYHEDPDRDKYYGWFKDEFLGLSDRAKDCTILNPQVLDLSYNDSTKTLTASSEGFLEVENDALGYKIKYQVTSFLLKNKDNEIFYEGPVLFEEMKGSLSREHRWQVNREEVYENSPMRFLRAGISDKLAENGFRAQQFAIYANPERPSDSLINARIKFYKDLRSKTAEQRDSLSFWEKKLKLPKTLKKLLPFPLKRSDIIQATDKPGVYAFGCDNDEIYVAYSKNRHYHINDKVNYLYNKGNDENTLVGFKSPQAFFNSNGVILNPFSVVYYGVWGKNRVAELLPIDYEPLQNPNTTADDNFDDVINSKLEKYLTDNITEKAYLQFDKPYYAVGDTIYFKAYVTKGEQHELSDLSGVLHVDLINTNNRVDQSIKLKIDSGVAWGDFALPDSLPKGNYRVRAYTEWMRNDSEKDFFDKVIPVGSAATSRISKSAVKQTRLPVNQKPDIQFFPEGGGMVTGTRSKIAFKAISANGLGIEVKGTIVDNENNQIGSFTSVHLGMGYFYLTPAVGETYRAELSYADGTKDVVDLPKPGPAGLVLSVDNDSLPKASVTIATNAAYYRENRNKEYALVIYSGGVAATVHCKLDSPVIKLDILKRKLPTGVATVTLFSPGNEPLAERLFFVQNYNQLSLNVNSDKKKYAKRENVNIKLNVLNRRGDPAEGHFSVSVVDERKVPEGKKNEDNIVSSLLLTSDLKGYVEQPGWYFADSTETTRKDLDILMLTQGYRRFAWKQVLDSADRPLAYQLEKEIEIRGTIKSLAGKPIDRGTINLIPSKGGPMLIDTSDDKGMFRFSNLTFTDTAHYVLSAVNAQGKNSTKISFLSDAQTKPEVGPSQQQAVQQVADTTMQAYMAVDKLQQNELLNNDHSKRIMLKEVKVKDRRLIDEYRTQSLAGAGHADQVMHADEINRIGGQLSTSLNGRLRGVVFYSGVPYLTLNLMPNVSGTLPPPMLVIVDGAIMNGSNDPHSPPPNVDFITGSTVETIEVLRYASASIYGADGGNGVLIITTKQGGGLSAKDIPSIGVLPIAPMGFYKAREFYSPRYDHADLTGKQRDFRSTIYWKPEIKTGKDGSASFEYYNADGAGTYKVVVEGIDNSGNIGRQVYRYRVE